MLENLSLQEATKPEVVVCPECARHLMEVKDVRWAMTQLEFIYACQGCGAETKRSLAGNTPVFTSRASAFLQNLEIFSFDPPAPSERKPPPLPTYEPSSAASRFGFFRRAE